MFSKIDVFKGGEFLISDMFGLELIFILEEMNEEQFMICDMVRDFLNIEIFLNIDCIEVQEEGLALQLLEKMVEFGLLGFYMFEEYGGMQLDININIMICDVFGLAVVFIVFYVVYIGIGMLFIFYFGDELQKVVYLLCLINGELKVVYCLMELSFGFDVLVVKIWVDLSKDGNYYVINGQKMWIFNVGFVDIFIVFVQIDGDKFIGLIVECDFEGLILGVEEKKLGIKGFFICQVFFENVKVFKENVLGEIGKGYFIVFNVLNIGCFKLCVFCVGGVKKSVEIVVQYVNECIQFKQLIVNFGVIKYKLGE